MPQILHSSCWNILNILEIYLFYFRLGGCVFLFMCSRCLAASPTVIVCVWSFKRPRCEAGYQCVSMCVYSDKGILAIMLVFLIQLNVSQNAHDFCFGLICFIVFNGNLSHICYIVTLCIYCGWFININFQQKGHLF